MKLGELAQYSAGNMWVVPRYYEYLRHRDQHAEGEHIRRLLQPDRVRKASFSASGAGECNRARMFSYNGEQQIVPDDKAANIFANGDYFHLRVQAAGLISGWLVDAEVPVEVPEYSLRGTLDGVLSNGEGLELKSINTHGFASVRSFGPKKAHILQTHSYMFALGLEAFRIVYEDKNTQDMKEFLVKRDEKIIDQVRAELEYLNMMRNQRELPPMLEECERKPDKWCPYRTNCPNAEWPSESSRRLSIRLTSSSARS